MSVDSKTFFAMPLQNTKDGFFSDPIYGGNNGYTSRPIRVIKTEALNPAQAPESICWSPQERRCQPRGVFLPH